MVRGVPIWDGPAYLLLWNRMAHGAEKPRFVSHFLPPTGKKSVESFRNHCVIEKITRKSIEACDFDFLFNHAMISI